MSGAARRSFQAEMTLKSCDGNARLAERVFGWGRVNVEVGLAEHHSGTVCADTQAGYRKYRSPDINMGMEGDRLMKR